MIKYANKLSRKTAVRFAQTHNISPRKTAFIIGGLLIMLTVMQSFGIDAYAGKGTTSTATIIAPKKTEEISETTANGTVISAATDAPIETISDETAVTDTRFTTIVSAASDSGSTKGSVSGVTEVPASEAITEASAQTQSQNGASAASEAIVDNTAAGSSTAAEGNAAASEVVTINNLLTGPEAGAIAGTGSSLSTGGFSLQNECFDNLSSEPLLSGGEVRFLANTGGTGQQLSAVFKSSDGRVIVVDGGREEDAEHLVSVIKEFGGKVDAWLITHPQTDHVGALNKILKDKRKDISIGGIYYNFLEQAWYDANDSDECGMVRTLRESLAGFDQSGLHADMTKGSSVTLSDNLSFRVLNAPQKSTGIFAGNSAGLMYDILIGGKHFIILGDMAKDVGDKLMSEGVLDGVICDFVQISHHGQTGVSDEFYAKLNPSYCIWPTNEYIFNAVSVNNSGLGTTKTKMCILKLKVKANFVTLGRDVIIK